MDIPGAKMGNLSLTGVMGATTKEHGAQLVEDLLQLTKLWEVFVIFADEAPAVASF